MKSRVRFSRLVSLLALLLMVALFGQTVQAADVGGEVAVSKAIQGNLTTVDAGVEFTYLINYSYASTTEDGQQVLLTDLLDPDLSWAGAEVIPGSTIHIASTAFNPATGQVTWTFVDPLPAGSSGQLTLKVRFPNGATAPGTIAANTATMDGDNTDPATSNNVDIAATSTCGWVTNVTGPTTAQLGVNVTYRVRLDRPNPSTGHLNTISPSTTSLTLPVGVLPGDVVDAAGGTISGAGTTGDPVIVTWNASGVSASGSANSEAFGKSLVIKYDPARFTASQVVSVSQASSLTVLGGDTCGGSDSQNTTIQAFTSTANGTVAKSNSDSTIIPDTQEFYFHLDASSSGNVGLDDFIISDELPQNFGLTSIRLPAVSNGPGGNFINLVYRRSDTGATEYTWPGSPFAAGTTTLPVSALSLPGGAYVSYVRFDMGTVASNFNISDNIRLYGTLLTTGWGSPSNVLVTADQVCNTMSLSAVYNGLQAFTPKTSQSCVTAIKPTVRPTVAKSVVSGGSVIPGQTTKWQVEVSNPSSSDIPMVNPKGMDLLPASLEYVTGSFVSRTDGSFNSSGAGVPTLEVIDNYNGTGRTLLRWSYAHSFPINTRATVQFETRVKPGSAPGTISNLANVSVVPGDQGPNTDVVYASPVTDSNDLNGNSSSLDKIGVSTAPSITVNSAASLDSFKLVKGQLDTGYTKYPDTGSTSPGGTADYRLVVKNTGNVPLKNVLIVDILPTLNDTAVTSTTPRNSEWTPFLAGPVAAPAGVTVEYSIEANPCRDEMGNPDPFPAGCAAPNWSAVPPVDITTVSSLRFNLGSLILGPLDEFELAWPMRAPVDAPDNGEIAWNSFGVVATRADNNSPLLPTEPFKVGITLEPIQPAAYGDTVWNDLNRDGIQDPGEPGLNGVRVELYRDNGDGIADPTTDEYVGFTLTAGGGGYVFTNLPAGDYFAVFYQPPTYLVSPQDQGANDGIDSDGTPTTVGGFPATIAPVTKLTTGEIDLTWDQGFYQPVNPVAAVGNYVWNDQNGNGLQDEAASAGLNGITVNLYDSSNNLVGTTTTHNDVNGNPGYYLFDGLTPGDYSVEFVRPSGFTFTTQGATGTSDANDSDPNVTTGRTETFTLSGGEYDPTWDAGMLLPAGVLSLGDRVWNDADFDGIYDPSEVGINNVRLNLYRDDDGSGDFTPGVDTFLATTTTFTKTGVPGYYEFTNLPAGDYIVQVDPSNFVAGNSLAGLGSSFGNAPAPNPNDNVDNDDNGQPLAGYGVVSQAINLKAGEEPAQNGNNNPTLDFGFNAPALGTIGDTVWSDLDGNGIQDPGELGIPGITVQLTPPPDVDLGNGPGNPVTDTTDVNGKYLFEDLPPGSYTVTVTTPPTGTANTGDPDGGADSTSTLVLPPNGINLDQDFGYQPLGKIGDTVWYDDDGDGVQDAGELGIPGLTVQLTPPAGVDLGNGPGNPVTDTTDASGKYLFENLPQGDYTVTVTTPPAGLTNTGDPDGGADSTSNLTLPAGGSNLDQDFGYQPLGKIGDTVWYDIDGNGVQDAGEPGIAGITVQLTPPAGVDLGNGPGIPVTDTTDANGKYLFENLPKGDYTVTVTTPPAGLTNTGDPDGGANSTSNLTLPAGGANLNQDFGYQPLGKIGDTVFYDVYGNGIQDAGDAGIPNVTVKLEADYDGDGTIDATFTDMTDASGKYLFEHLPAGTYTVTVMTPPAGYVNTADPDGGNDSKSKLILASGETNLLQDFGYQQPIVNTCPVGAATSQWTDILGIGMGNMSKHKSVTKINIPNSADVLSLYGQLAGKEDGLAKYVRFYYPGKNNFEQVDSITSPAPRSAAVFWYGTDLEPTTNIRGRWFLQKSGIKAHIPRALILYPTYQAKPGVEYVNVFELMQSADTQVYWYEEGGWVASRRIVIDIPAPFAPATFNVKLAMVDNDKDARPIYVTVSAGGVSQEMRPTNPDRGDMLNILQFTLANVPPGTSEIVIDLVSPPAYTDGLGLLGGDSVAITGVVANYECLPVGN